MRRVQYQGGPEYVHRLIQPGFYPAVAWPLGPRITIDRADRVRTNNQPHDQLLTDGRMQAHVLDLAGNTANKVGTRAISGVWLRKRHWSPAMLAAIEDFPGGC